jgi:hypothetical protein
MPSKPPEDDRSMPPPRPPSGDWAKATEHLWKTLQSINEWTRFADAKAGAVLAANGVLGTLAAGFAKDHWAYLSTNSAMKIIALLGGSTLIASSFVCVRCLLPRTKVKGGTRSRLFFHHIALEDEASYLASAGALGDDDEAFREVGKQVWANAKVAREKHQEIFWAILLTGGSLACALAVWIVVFLAR